jgi:ribosomal protein S18 acetylase RimI-like enzyme
MNSSTNNIQYKQKKASASNILCHFSNCKKNFIDRLEERVDLEEYSQKIADKCITFEAWDDDILIGLVAAYFNDINHVFGYITSVSTIEKHSGKGIASNLLTTCIEYACKNSFKKISLEVSNLNLAAIKLYKKHRFNKVNGSKDVDNMELALC